MPEMQLEEGRIVKCGLCAYWHSTTSTCDAAGDLAILDSSRAPDGLTPLRSENCVTLRSRVSSAREHLTSAAISGEAHWQAVDRMMRALQERPSRPSRDL